MARVLQAPESSGAANVHLYHDDGSILGRVYQNGSITGDNFYDICTIFLDFQGSPSWSIFAVNDDGTTGIHLPRDRNALAPGRYIVLSENGAAINVTLTLKEAARRVYTPEEHTSRLSNMQRHFRDELRNRDYSCAMSGHKSGDPEDLFIGLEAAHIFPLARRNEWVDEKCAHWITDNAPSSCIGDNRMYSPQNGLLLNSILHCEFDKYNIAVNPKDNYKIIALKNVGNTITNVDGRHLQSRTINPANGLGVSDNALRWHFEQAVLAHVKGAAGKPAWDFDLGGGDEIGEIMEGPYAGERMEAELYTRLGIRDGVNMT